MQKEVKVVLEISCFVVLGIIIFSFVNSSQTSKNLQFEMNTTSQQIVIFNSVSESNLQDKVILDNSCQPYMDKFICGNQFCKQFENYGWVCNDINPLHIPLKEYTKQDLDNFKIGYTTISQDNSRDWMLCGTYSMFPTFTCYDTLVAIEPNNKYNLTVGTVIKFSVIDNYGDSFGLNRINPNASEGFYLHRITEKGTDAGGLYYIAKGDYNPLNEEQKIRPYKVMKIIIGKLFV